MPEFQIELGERVKDRITGLKGIVAARIQYMTGCNQYGVNTRKLKADGNLPDLVWIDESRLEQLGGERFTLPEPRILAPARGRIEIRGGPAREMEPPKRN
jgi:hypothetical protein